MNQRMERLAPWTDGVYGVDCSETATVAVRARRRGRHLIFEPVDVASVTADPNRVATVVCAMPAGQAMAVWLQAPLTSASKARRVLPTLLDMAMPFPLDECICAFSTPERVLRAGDPVPGLPLTVNTEGQGCMAALALAARKADIARRLTVLAEKGIISQTLDHEGLALWTQALRESPPPAGPLRVRLVVRARRQEAVLAMGVGSVFWSAHRLTPMTPGVLERTVRVQLDAAAAGRYAQTPRSWFWSGDDAAACEVWRIPAEAALPGESVMLPDSETFLARALATRALTEGPLQFNLQSGSFAPPSAERQVRVLLYRRAAPLAALAAVLLMVNAAVMMARSRGEQSMEARFVQRVEQVTGWPVTAKGENAILIARRELEERQTIYAPLARAFAPSLLEPLSMVMGAAAAERIVLDSLLLQFDKIGLRGEAPSPAAAEGLTKRLGEILHYKPALKTMDTPEGRCGFVIEGGGEEGRR